MRSSILFAATLVLLAAARPAPGDDFRLLNGQDAIKLNAKFKSIRAGQNCDPKDFPACSGTLFAQCDQGKVIAQPCGAGTICAALPLVNKRGTSVTCVDPAQRDSRIRDTGATGGSSQSNSQQSNSQSNSQPNPQSTPQSNPPAQNPPKSNNNNNNANPAPQVNAKNEDPLKSLTLDPRVLAKGFLKNGQETPTPGQVASDTSGNNFINFCTSFLPKVKITDGKQITEGSCNPAPMGLIPSVDRMPSARWVFPRNGDVLDANQTFNLQVAVKNLATGNFVNPQTNYFAGPQKLNGQGIIIGHSHVTVEAVSNARSTATTDPRTPVFFKGINEPAKNGVLSTPIDGGLPPGKYRCCTLMAAQNHQPVVVPVAKRGSPDDCCFFTVREKKKNGGREANDEDNIFSN